jgi:hypothetical protein
MSIEEIINLHSTKCKFGLQLTKKNGILTSTWVLYFRKGFYYYFDICETFIFDEAHKYTKAEIINYFKNLKFEIDMSDI